MRYKKKGQESPVKGHNYEFSPLIFSNFRAFEILHPPKWRGFEGFNIEYGILFLKQGITCGYRTQQKAKIALCEG